MGMKIGQEKAQEALAIAEMKLREQQHKQRCFEQKTGEDDEDFDMFAKPPNPLIQKISIKSIVDVIFRDVGNKMKDSGKWPLILDPTGQASLFLKYQDTNYINILDTRNCTEEKIKNNFLGAIRFGKPIIIDLQNMDLWNALEAAFERIQTGLFNKILNKSIMDNQNYMSLVDVEKDDECYHPNKFVHGFADKMRFVVLSRMGCPPEEWVEKMYAVEVTVQEQ